MSWKVKAPLIKGSSYDEILKKARRYYRELEKRTKRETFIRCKALSKKKVFFTHFWEHLFQKSRPEQKRRLAFLACGIELIEMSTNRPDKYLLKGKSEKYYRLYGLTSHGQHFVVQIKEHIPTSKYFLMSIFPIKKSPAV